MPPLVEANRDEQTISSSAFDRNVAIALDRLMQRMQEGQPIDIQDLVSRLLLDSVSESSDSFRHILGQLSGDLPYPYYVSPKGVDEDKTPKDLVCALLETRRWKLLRAAEDGCWPLVDFWRELKQPSKVVSSSLAPFLCRKESKGKVTALGLSIWTECFPHRPTPCCGCIRSPAISPTGKSSSIQLSWLSV